MTDARLRSLARQAAVDPSARVALLRERMRAGERHASMQCPGPECKTGHQGRWTSVSFGFCPPCCNGTGRAPFRVAVELAAYCGDEAAREVSPHMWQKGDGTWHDDTPGGGCKSYAGLHVPGELCAERSLHAWLSGLDHWPGALVRAAVAAGWVALVAWANTRDGRGGLDVGYWLRKNEIDGSRQWMFTTSSGRDVISLESAPDGYWRYRPLHALEAAEAWIKCPCEERRKACWRLLIDWQRGIVPPDFAFQTLLLVARPNGHEAILAFTAAHDAARLAGETAVREAICEAMIKWALA